MRTLLYIKVIILGLMLIGVLYAMTSLNQDSVSKALLALGIEPGTAVSLGLQPGGRALGTDEQRLNLCRTRIHAVVWSDGRKVEELKEGLKLRWMAHDPQPREIGYLDMEKWLSQHCQIAVQARQPGTEPAASAFSAYVTIQFIDNSELKILRTTDGIYQIGELVARSEDLSNALHELEKIAQFADVTAH